MTEKFIAIAPKGQEFIFNKASMIAVPTPSAQKIADTLTELKYKLKEGQVWHVYDNDWYYNDYISSEIKKYGKKMPVVAYHG
jgi:signal recognition particle subunit SEC65